MSSESSEPLAARARGRVVELAGLPGSGKTTLSREVEARLRPSCVHGEVALPASVLSLMLPATVFRFRRLVWVLIKDALSVRPMWNALGLARQLILRLNAVVLRAHVAKRQARRRSSWVLLDEAYAQFSLSLVLRVSPANRDEALVRYLAAVPGRHEVLIIGAPPLVAMQRRIQEHGKLPSGLGHERSRVDPSETFRELERVLQRSMKQGPFVWTVIPNDGGLGAALKVVAVYLNEEDG